MKLDLIFLIILSFMVLKTICRNKTNTNNERMTTTDPEIISLKAYCGRLENRIIALEAKCAWLTSNPDGISNIRFTNNYNLYGLNGQLYLNHPPNEGQMCFTIWPNVTQLAFVYQSGIKYAVTTNNDLSTYMYNSRSVGSDWNN